MASHCTNIQAEQWALYRAIKYVTDNNHRYKGHTRFYTDSQTALKILINKRRYTGLSQELITAANNLGKTRKVIFNWVPGHQGNPGNELADKLAKRASTLDKEPTYKRLPNTWLKNQLHVIEINQWQRNWDSADTGRNTHDYIPSIHLRLKTKHYTPDAETSQILTGHGNFASYLCRFGKRETNTCNCDDFSEGNSNHLLFECPTYEQERLSFMGTCLKNGLNWPPRPKDIFNIKKVWNSLKNYIKNTKALCNNFRTTTAT
ncbi:uncharacterized protein LOC111624383 [Centruroides sculpturatus]|uniref:uncharacterized protein LOC111624383 n=1 Tax=Centruroides sculpturatus TaxID=218467 RepID=UPI000C6E204E|nr:uncharacterized protein LOC111624383 [Centruroides sculpturatus]